MQYTTIKFEHSEMSDDTVQGMGGQAIGPATARPLRRALHAVRARVQWRMKVHPQLHEIRHNT